jgi:hypothetical protein
MIGLLNNGLENASMLRGRGITKFEVLFWHLPGGADKNHESSL